MAHTLARSRSTPFQLYCSLPVHLAAVAFFGIISIVCFYDFNVGLILVAVFAFVASVRAIVKNILILLLVLGLVVLSILFPILAPLPIIAGIYLLIRRISFLFENIKIILLGCCLYAWAIFGVLIIDNTILSALPLWMDFPQYKYVVGLMLTFLPMHAALWIVYQWGYTTSHALEIMSVIPLLLLSLVLVFLKLDINFGHDAPVVSDPHPIYPDVHSYAPETHAYVPKLPSYVSESHSYVPEAHPFPVHTMANTHHITDVVEGSNDYGSFPAAESPILNNDSFGDPYTINNHLGMPEYTINHFGNSQNILDNQGNFEGRIDTFGKIQHVYDANQNHTGTYDVHTGNLSDPNGQYIGKLHSFGQTQVLEDHNGSPLYTAEKFGNQISIKNPFGTIVRTIPQSHFGGIEMFYKL